MLENPQAYKGCPSFNGFEIILVKMVLTVVLQLVFSGGKDSTIVAALCKEALGADRVVGVLMPNGVQSDIDDAQAVVNHQEFLT